MSRILEPISSSVQELWLGNGTQCYMPPTNFSVPIMCLIGSMSNEPPTAALSFSEYIGCCPPNANGTNIWEYRRGCGATCYTYETALAKGMGKCVGDISKALGNGKRTNETWATCEYIDYEALKTGKSQQGGVKRLGA